MKLLIKQSSPFSRHFLPLRSKYSPRYPVPKHVQSVFFPKGKRQNFTVICKLNLSQCLTKYHTMKTYLMLN